MEGRVSAGDMAVSLSTEGYESGWTSVVGYVSCRALATLDRDCPSPVSSSPYVQTGDAADLPDKLRWTLNDNF